MQEMVTYAERIRIQGNARESKKCQTSADNVTQGECLEIAKVPDLGRWGIQGNAAAEASVPNL